MDTVTTPTTGKPIDLSKLQEKFPADALEWRIGRSGEKNGKIWATALPYLTSRAIMDRLDEVCGPENWKNEFREWTVGNQPGVLCGISIRVNGEWITKHDGADNTDVESTKGGFSAAMKRAAVPWGIGRYLYGIGETFAVIDEHGSEFGSFKDSEGKTKRFRWNPPKLPAAALPSATPPQPSEPRGAAARPAQAVEKTAELATPAQMNCIEKLARTICVDVEKDLYTPRGIARTPTKSQASAIITYLKGLKPSPPRKQAPAKAA
jgi:hypothetical protein